MHWELTGWVAAPMTRAGGEGHSGCYAEYEPVTWWGAKPEGVCSAWRKSQESNPIAVLNHLMREGGRQGGFKDKAELDSSELHCEWKRVHIQNFQQGRFQPDRQTRSPQQERLSTVGEIANRGCGIPILGNTQSLVGEGPEHLNQTLKPALLCALGWTRWSRADLSNLNYSVLL